MFKVGDKIVYPLHGAGTIESIESKKVLGEAKDYFVLKLPVRNMKVMLPLDNVHNLGLRNIEDAEQLDEVYEVLAQEASDMSSNWNRRYRDNMEKVRTGDICEVATVVRDLMIMDSEKGLSTGEKKMLNNAKQILISEIAMINDYEWSDAEKTIDEIVAKVS